MRALFGALLLVPLLSAADQLSQPPGVPTGARLCLDQGVNLSCLSSDGTNASLSTAGRFNLGPVVPNDFFGTTLATQVNTAAPGQTIWHLLDTTTSTYPRFQWIFSGASTYATDANRYLGWIFNLDRGLTDHAGWKDAAGNNLIKCRGWTDAGVNQDWTCQGATYTYDWGGVAYAQRKASFNITMQAQGITAFLINETTAPSADSMQVLASDGTTKRLALNQGTLKLQTGIDTATAGALALGATNATSVQLGAGGLLTVSTASTGLTLKGNAPASGVGIILDNVTAQTSGKTLSVRSGGVELAYFDKDGGLIAASATLTAALPIASGGTNNGALAVTAGGVVITDGSKLANSGAGTSGYVLTSNGASAPSFQTPAAPSVASGQSITYTAACDSTGSPGAATCNQAAGRAAIAATAGSVVITDSIVSTSSRVFAVLQENDTTCVAIKSVVPGSGTFTINVNAVCTGNTDVAWVLQ